MKITLIPSGSSKPILVPEQPVITIGRSPDCNIRQPDDTISRKHCILTRDGEDIFIQDPGSANGTFINGKEIPKNSKPIKLSNGDELKFGKFSSLKVKIEGVAQKEEKPDDNMKPITDDEDPFGDATGKKGDSNLFEIPDDVVAEVQKSVGAVPVKKPVAPPPAKKLVTPPPVDQSKLTHVPFKQPDKKWYQFWKWNFSFSFGGKKKDKKPQLKKK